MKTRPTLTPRHNGRRHPRGALLAVGMLAGALLLTACDSTTYGGKAPRAPKPATAPPPSAAPQTPAPASSEQPKPTGKAY